MHSTPTYRSYLLRLRRVDAEKTGSMENDNQHADENTWRISLQEAGSQQELFFATLDALLIHLAAQLQIDASAGRKQTDLRA